MTYIILSHRGDRLGSQLHNYILQIIYAYHHNYSIKYEPNLPYTNNKFMKYILDFVDKYNKNFTDLCTDVHSEHIFHVAIKTVFALECDAYTYFKKHIWKPSGIPSKTILVHLRLEDVKHRPDYDGRISSDYYQTNMNNGINIGLVPELDHCNVCGPLSYDKIQVQINNARQKYPTYEVIIVTSPGEKHVLPYRYIQSKDPVDDLLLLCNSEVVILSRSTFALASLFFGIQKEVYVPLWGFAVSNGLYTKYDHCKYNYFF